ncbi:MAG: DinB family protein [Acidobacteria bacterium]|nr:DinB family protein [Acidobacteriota bacterium]
MSVSAAFLQEFEREAQTTRRVLERVPADKFSWKPHPKSMTLGQLALHVASVPDHICAWACEDETKFGGASGTPSPGSSADLTAALDKSIAKMKDTMAQLGDAGLMAHWKATANGATVFEMPKVALIRTIALNHWYHHRGQLSVYLRLLDVPVPAIYGPSADEQPVRS